MKLIPFEKHSRSLTKSISYRILSISVDMMVAYIFTRNVYTTIGIVAFVDLYSTVLYYLHERVWAHVKWGRK